jgi:uncharacterized protein YyaL (SSP411 family)
MERESFEDEAVAEVLNERFVAIKVDREERPDVDHVYMTACQALTGEGGWPLTVLMTPDRKPFFVGTYFPKTARYGRPGFVDILQRMGKMWDEQRERLLENADRLVSALSERSEGARASGGASVDPLMSEHILSSSEWSGGEVEIGLTDMRSAYDELRAEFDSEFGGFGWEPKFPMPHNLLFLLRYGVLAREPEAVSMVVRTLDGMRQGGLFDHVGFGFSRYSVDRRWEIPHFEKMLYDNALLGLAYAEAFQVTGMPRFKNVAEDVLSYVKRELTSPDGAFYCAQDADSEGEEGKFYAWTPEEICAVLGNEAGSRVMRHFGVSKGGNLDGRSILHTIRRADSTDGKESLSPAAPMLLEEEWEAYRQKLFVARERRIHPALDDKILTAWNALMMVALATSGRLFEQQEYVNRAASADAFLWRHMRRGDGRLLARYRDGEAAHLGCLHDYSFYAWALMELYDATLHVDYVVRANALLEEMLHLFADPLGGFYLTASDAEALFVRPKDTSDGALPSGYSVAVACLFKMGRMTGNDALTEAARRAVRVVLPEMRQYPSAHTFLFSALCSEVYPGTELVVVGPSEDSRTIEMLRIWQRAGIQNGTLLHWDASQRPSIFDRLPEYPMVDGQPTAYLCRNFACQAPVTEPSRLAADVKNLLL